jgi:hypothetical protein
MSRHVDIPQSAISYAENIIDQHQAASEIIKAVSVLFAAKTNLSVDEISEVLQINRRTFFRYRDEIITLADNPIDAGKESWGGRRHTYLTQEEETAFLATFIEESRKGAIVSATIIHEALIKYIGHSISLSTTTRLLERNGWRKVVPDTQHPKADFQLQEEFKKKHFRSAWLPPLKKTNITKK